MREHSERRFPFDAYLTLTEWFHVAYSDEAAVGQLVGMNYFGRRLICYRDSSDQHLRHDNRHGEQLKAVRGGFVGQDFDSGMDLRHD